MNITKILTHNKTKYKYIFCNIHGLIDFFKKDFKIIANFESIMKDHRPHDQDFKYTKILHEDIQSVLYENTTTYYQFIYDPRTLEFITIIRGMILDTLISLVCMISMVHTNSAYRNQKFCQKNIKLFMSNVNSTISNKKSDQIEKFCLYVDKDNVSAIKCYEKCSFKIIKLHKEKYYLMERNN